MMTQIAMFWTQVEGEEERIRTFARIPDDYKGDLADLPRDEEVFYWLTNEEWISLGAGETYGDAEILACACDECETERYSKEGEE